MSEALFLKYQKKRAGLPFDEAGPEGRWGRSSARVIGQHAWTAGHVLSVRVL